MDLSEDAIAAGRAAYDKALLTREDPVKAALTAAIAEVLKPVSLDRHKKWSSLEAVTVFNEKVRPRTFTLYDDALALTSGANSGHNLFMLMSYLISQTLHDLYSTTIAMGNVGRFPTEQDFIEWYAVALMQQSEGFARRQEIIDRLKPGEE